MPLELAQTPSVSREVEEEADKREYALTYGIPVPRHRYTLNFKKLKIPLTMPYGHPGSQFCTS